MNDRSILTTSIGNRFKEAAAEAVEQQRDAEVLELRRGAQCVSFVAQQNLLGELQPQALRSQAARRERVRTASTMLGWAGWSAETLTDSGDRDDDLVTKARHGVAATDR